MTVAELITNLLSAIESKFYRSRPHEFMRDLRDLKGAIGQWGIACDARGWEFEPGFVFKEIMEILLDIQRRDLEVDWMPVYLRGAIRRRIGQRAEELNAESKRIGTRIAKALAPVKIGEVRAPTTNEVLIALAADMKRLKRDRRQQRAGSKEQASLL